MVVNLVPEELRPQSNLRNDGTDERPAKRPRIDDWSTTAQQRRELGLMRQSDPSSDASFVGSSSGIYFVRSVYSALAKPGNSRPPPETPDQNIVPGEEDQLGEAVPSEFKGIWSSLEIDQGNSNGTFQSNFEDLQVWTESYFENWHTAYPFIRAPRLLQYLEQSLSSEALGDLAQVRPPQILMVRSIISISLADQRQAGKTPEKPLPAPLVFNSFEDALESIQSLIFAPTSIEVLQAVVSVQLFLVSMLRLNGASKLGGLIVRMAFQMGLHRCPSRYPNFTPEEIEIRQRLFWTIYCIDRHLCQALGLPLTIHDDDVDVCYFDDEQHHTHNQRKSEMDDRLQMLNLLTKHASIKGQIVELRNKSIHRRYMDRDQATLIGARIDKWSNNFQWYLESVDEEGLFTFNPLHRAILSALKYECVISLHRPLLAIDKKSPEYIAALQTCIHASRSVISTLYKYLRTIPQAENRAPLLWPSLTWCVWMSAFIILHAAIEGEVSTDVAKRLADQSVDILKHLSQRGSVWPNVCAVAINDLFSRLLQSSPVTGPDGNRPIQNLSNAETVLVLSTDSRRPENGSNNTVSHVSEQDMHEKSSHFASIGTPQHYNQGRHDLVGIEDSQFPSQTALENLLSDHTFNINGPSSANLQNNLPIPWLNGPDATAATSENIFEQFDIPFWMGDDQYTSLMEENEY